MITLLSITASILALYGVCVTYLLWVWYVEYQQLEKYYKQIMMDRNAEAREANERLWKLRAANDEVEQLKEELAKWQNRAGLAETKLEQVKMVVK
jgi:biopolymer transport protein ExbB/TolQ